MGTNVGPSVVAYVKDAIVAEGLELTNKPIPVINDTITVSPFQTFNLSINAFNPRAAGRTITVQSIWVIADSLGRPITINRTPLSWPEQNITDSAGVVNEATSYRFSGDFTITVTVKETGGNLINDTFVARTLKVNVR